MPRGAASRRHGRTRKEAFDQRSGVVLRDQDSRRALEEVLGTGWPDAEWIELTGLLEGLVDLGATALWLEAAMYMANEGVTRHPVGEFLKQAYAADGVKIAFDLEARGLTERLLRDLDEPNPLRARRSFLCWPKDPPVSAHDSPPRRHRYSFHPKLLTMGLRLRGGPNHILKLALIGSGNLTMGGMDANHELGVLSARLERDAQPRGSGWDAADEALSRFFGEARELRDDDELPRDARQQRQMQAVDRLEPWVLRDYQEDAVKAVMSGWTQTKRSRRSRGGLLVLPPGAGKTIVAMESIRRLMDEDDGIERVLWLAPTPRLARQALDEWRRFHRPIRLRPGEYPRSATATAVAVDQNDRVLVQDADELENLPLAKNSSGAKKLEELLSPSHPTPVCLFIGKGKAASMLGIAKKSAEGSGVLLEWPCFVVADEAHHAHGGQWRNVIEAFDARMVLGLTATPFYKTPDFDHDENRRLLLGTRNRLAAFDLGSVEWSNCLFAKLNDERADKAKVLYARTASEFFGEQESQVEEQWVLSKPSFEVVAVTHQGELVRLSGKKGKAPHQHIEKWLDSEEGGAVNGKPVSSLSAAQEARTAWFAKETGLDNPELVAAALTRIDEDAIETALSNCKEGVVLLFARNIAHAKFLCAQIKPHWADVLGIHGGVPQDERRAWRKRLAAVGRQRKGLVVAVDMISEGVDLPEIASVILPRWTTSDRLFWQMLGRGLRGPASDGTPRCTLRCYELDFAEVASDGHQHPDDLPFLSPRVCITNTLGQIPNVVLSRIEVPVPSSTGTGAPPKATGRWVQFKKALPLQKRVLRTLTFPSGRDYQVFIIDKRGYEEGPIETRNPKTTLRPYTRRRNLLFRVNRRSG